MNSKNIRKEMFNQGVGIPDLMEATGYSRSHISRVINGRYDSPKVKKIIALILQKDFDYLWPEETTVQATNHA